MSKTVFSEEKNFIIESQDNYFFIKETSSGDFILANTFNGIKPKILRIKKIENFSLIYFDGGEAGTKKQVRHEMVAIFDIKKKEFKEKIYVTKLIGLEPSAQPKFNIKNGKIIYNLPKN